MKSEIDLGVLVISLIVWVTIAASVIAMVVFAGIQGVVFAFIVLVVAVPVWSRVLRDERSRGIQQNEAIRLQIDELNRKLDDIKKTLEE